jgi:hypothetical protein
MGDLARMLNFQIYSSHGGSTNWLSCANCTWSFSIFRHSSFHCPRGLTLPGGPVGDSITDKFWLHPNPEKLEVTIDY